MFPDITGTKMTSGEFTQKLVKEEKVRAVSGAGYGAGHGEGNVRFSMIRPLSTQKMRSWFPHKKGMMLEDAMDRIERFVNVHT
jgi:aspartate/methionine/tyrosine aminotransferase